MNILVTGISGQDGAWLAKKLISGGHKVFGALRRGSLPKSPRLEYLGISNDVQFVSMELTEFGNVYQVVNEVKPNMIFNLAAQSFVADSFKHPSLTFDINFNGYLNILEAIKISGIDCAVYQASTSEMFGATEHMLLNESSRFEPKSPYAVSKSAAHFLGQNYRLAYGMGICNGILFNHESELRGREFVTRKISLRLNEIKSGFKSSLTMGNLDSYRDWGHAEDYVDAMIQMMLGGFSDDYVIATKESHSVREFIISAGNVLGMDIEFVGEGLNERGINRKTGEVIVNVSEEFFRPSDVTYLLGDYSKAKNSFGWNPTVSFESLVERMVCSDQNFLKKGYIPF